MNSEFYEIYGEMLEEYRDDYRFGPRRFFRMFSPSSDQSFRLIEKAVEEVCEQKKVKLRPDAKYFLITNFHQMVAMPVTIAFGRQVQGNISELIREDISLIISTAGSRLNEQKEITGGMILRTVGEMWDKLKTNAENIWS